MLLPFLHMQMLLTPDCCLLKVGVLLWGCTGLMPPTMPVTANATRPGCLEVASALLHWKPSMHMPCVCILPL
jgi:hypothetical protein